MDQPALAPLWRTSEWLNTPAPIDLEAQRGHVVVACAFQMLCPGCVAHVIPQIKAVHDLFGPQGVVVVGLHTVFEHHDAMTVTALSAFVHEYGIRFPVGVDRPADNGGPVPQTMAAYRMQGTPTLILIDRAGQLRRQIFGHIPDLRLGAEIMRFVDEH
ncbi:redoxin family protein [Thiobacillus sp.]|uniref:redoxin family protein n=1 Tax=Thiobacillus sp. TaxID=924 RepID=UPI001AC24B6A|nr:redoxin family protein [Thiobacillus sp.]MBN8779906.1 redoxin family protein [Thiobacillus sp.]